MAESKGLISCRDVPHNKTNHIIFISLSNEDTSSDLQVSEFCIAIVVIALYVFSVFICTEIAQQLDASAYWWYMKYMKFYDVNCKGLTRNINKTHIRCGKWVMWFVIDRIFKIKAILLISK